MAFISAFDVLGPNMIGPSSSHTAGAVATGLLAQKMITGPVCCVTFTLYGSFAKTYQGHGTDRALLGGIMGFQTDVMTVRGESLGGGKSNALKKRYDSGISICGKCKE